MSDGPTESRTERARSRSSRRRKIATIGVAALTTVLVVTALVWLAATRVTAGPTQTHASAAVAGVPVVAVSSPTAGPSAAASRIEVPHLARMTVAQAATVLRAAGLTMRVVHDGTVTSTAELVVHSQQPLSGTVAIAGSTVVVTVPTLARKTKSKESGKPSHGKWLVVIDPGHQSSTDQLLEPIGPGSTEQKARMTAGATGLMSGVPEYEINLEIATNLQKRLEAAGVRVVMTRTTNDVDVSNAERAQIANRANADLFIRLHADSSTDPSAVGVSTVYPDVNTWTKPIVASSRKAAIIIQQRLLSSTSARDDGSSAQSDIAGFNWAKVPAVLVRAGFQSNSVEDQLLSSARYQDLLAQGMADGVLAYLNGGR